MENEFGRGKRKKIMRQFTDEDSFSTNNDSTKRVKNILSSDDSDFGREDSAKQQFGCKQVLLLRRLSLFNHKIMKLKKKLIIVK